MRSICPFIREAKRNTNLPRKIAKIGNRTRSDPFSTFLLTLSTVLSNVPLVGLIRIKMRRVTLNVVRSLRRNYQDRIQVRFLRRRINEALQLVLIHARHVRLRLPLFLSLRIRLVPLTSVNRSIVGQDVRTTLSYAYKNRRRIRRYYFIFCAVCVLRTCLVRINNGE